MDNSCELCYYKSINSDPELHCYMYKTEPEVVCMSNTFYKDIIHISTLARSDDPPKSLTRLNLTK